MQTQLREIVLSLGEGLTDECFLPITLYCNKLESVTLWWCSGFTDLAFQSLAYNRNAGLKRLQFYHVKDLTDHLEKLQAHRRLKDVHFYFCNIDDDLKGYYQDQ
ncbi:14465_t:CDS:2, partial [Racocetra fulgida]